MECKANAVTKKLPLYLPNSKMEKVKKARESTYLTFALCHENLTKYAYLIEPMLEQTHTQINQISENLTKYAYLREPMPTL
jgi:hypothetical protein